MSETFPKIRAAAVDERAHNVFFRQNQLERLCKALIARTDDIQQAIVTDYGHTISEVAVEIQLTIAAVKADYASMQPTKEHESEYLIANGKDAADTRKPVGIVYIEPSSHTLFYSVIVPLSAAIAAGNCVIVLLENNLRTLSSLLRQLLTSTLEQDTFAVASSPIKDAKILDNMIHVDQRGSDRYPKANQIISLSSTSVIAVVDRTANVRLAARELVAARFSYQGRSPYAPDCVLVNEFVKKEFLQAVVSECAQFSDSASLARSGKEKPSQVDQVKGELETSRSSDSGLRIVVQEPRLAVVETSSRKSDLITRKIDSPVLTVHAITSLDDAIDLIGSTIDGPCLAAYHFSNASTGKYLAQFVDSAATFVNHIPRELLVGPASPTSMPFHLGQRYTPALFSVPRPAFIQTSLKSSSLVAALASSDNTIARGLLAEAKIPLAVMKRSEGGGVGFFEQGFLMSASLLLVSIVSISGIGIYFTAKHARRFW